MRRLQLPTIPALRSSVLLTALLLAAAVAPAAAAGAAARVPAVDGAAATDPAFIPDWDGESDSTAIDYRVLARSFVRVVLIDGAGREVRTLDSGTREAGAHVAYWNGRDTSGEALPAGQYRIRVIAVPRPRPGGGEPGSANAGGNVGPGSSDAVITLEEPPVAVRSISLSRGSIGARRSINSVRATFRLTRDSTVSAAIVDGSGVVVRTITVGALAKGNRSVLWDGRTSTRALAADGAYSMLVAATGGAEPTATLKVPMRVDRTTPGLRSARSVRATSSRRSVTVPITLGLTEPARLTVRIGRARHSVDVPAGQRTISVPGRALGLRPSLRTRVLTARVLVSDQTGNASSRRVRVTVPPAPRATVAKPRPKPAPKPRPTTPVPTPPVPATPLPSGFGWPSAGIVTSLFGNRWGRMHEGIDIGLPTGQPINAALTGSVEYVGPMSGYGNIVILAHAEGLQTRYAHLSAPAADLVVGDRVSRGRLLGLSGCTGHCTGPHLHFETRVNGVAKDPMAYLPAR